MIRRCPQCGSTTDDMYGFCIKCGREFQKIEANEFTCPLCGFKNPEEADYCVKCGTPLLFKTGPHTEASSSVKPIIIKKEISASPTHIPNTTSRWIILFGYIFSILGGILGLIIAIYLSTRKDPVARKHGHIQLAIFVFYIALLAILYATGNIPINIMTQYKQILSGNFSSI